jgi:hypothetical protein
MAARMLGAAGGRLRSVAVVVGPRMTPFAPHAGRRCPLAPELLAPAAAFLPLPAPEHVVVRSFPVKVPPFSAGGAYSDGDKTEKVRARGTAGRWRRPEEEGADGHDDVAADDRTNEAVKIAPFSSGGAHSGSKKPGKAGTGGRRTEVAPTAPTPRRAPEHEVRSVKVPTFSRGDAYSDDDKTGKFGPSGNAGRWSRAQKEGADGNDVAADGRSKIAPFSIGGAHSSGKKLGKAEVGGRRGTEVADGKDVAAGGHASEAVKLISAGGAPSDREKPGANGVAARTIDEADGKGDADGGGLTEPDFGDEEVDAVPAPSCCRYESDLKQFIRSEMARDAEARTPFLLDLFEKNRY